MTSHSVRTIASFLLTVTAALVAMPTMARAAEADRPPNVVFVLIDNAGKDWFRCYGSQEDATPNIDRLARTGLKFRHCYVTPVCSTSRVMLLTGRYPFTTGWHTHHDPAIYGGGYFDWDREVSFARVMQSAGYRTCIAGKWQINDLFDSEQKDAITRHGFHEHCLFPEGPVGHPAHKNRYWDAYIVANGERVDTAGKFGPDVTCDHLIDFMKRNRERPFFAYYSDILTHIPVVTTPSSPDGNASAREKFEGMVRHADRTIGRIAQALDDLGLRENTILIVTCDNGTDNGTDQGLEQRLGGRLDGRVSEEGIYSLKEGGINVPLIVNCPALVPGGRESDDLIDATDFLPTLAELGGAKLPPGVKIDGRSFAPQVLGEEPEKAWRPWCLSQYYKTRVVRNQRYKLYSTGAFHDLSEDPLERHDLSRKPEAELRLEDIAGRRELQSVLDGLPEDAKLPWEFRSISARAIRAQEDAERKAKE
ncbi:MAG: sulfatase-like hydrolase/transferase [Planctomycetales bacterium]